MRPIVMALFFLSFHVNALEIDEKLTLRIIDTSESQKTILINRGQEDGLAIGDHAKFYVSAGVIGRGVVIKTSPSRSVWSVYRLVNKEFIRKDQVLKLKVTPAVKITKDESKMLVQDDSRAIIPSDPRDLGIPLAEGADDLNELERKGQGSTDGFSEFSSSGVSSLLSYNKEVFGMIGFENSAVTTSSDDSDTTYDTTQSSLYLWGGGEFYFKQETTWYSRFSLILGLGLISATSSNSAGSETTNSTTEFSFGSNLYFSRRPSQVQKFIPYLNYTLGLGTSEFGYDDDTDSSSGSGSMVRYALGFGFKYYTVTRLGFKAEFSYQIRGDSYTADLSTSNDSVSYTRTATGPQLLTGIVYRF